MTAVLMLVMLSSLRATWADTPANCSWGQVAGVWEFHIGPGGYDSRLRCSSFTAVESFKLSLLFPDVVLDKDGNKGFWTMIYNQGFEVVINQRKYFAFSSYTKADDVVTSFCNSTFAGWSHDTLGKDWACYYGIQFSQGVPDVNPVTTQRVHKDDNDATFRNNPDFIKGINSVQRSWKAVTYPEYHGMKISNMALMAGGPSSTLSFPRPTLMDKATREAIKHLPKNFDWRNIDGQDFVSAVKDQGNVCGSCYAQATAIALESRLRIMTNNTLMTTMSPQDVVSCSDYSQGCKGGFPYLTAKYAQDFGMVEERCNPYHGHDTACRPYPADCRRYYVADYQYIGGYYGACNEGLMMLDLVKNGPIPVSFQVYDDFRQYHNGIYHHTGLKDGWNPWKVTDHVVTIVGYGIDPSSDEKYWIAQNTWGTDWGELGYFKIRRGTNEVNIESIAVTMTPIVPNP
ncbi:dipeptidyl peptidase 1-like [Branchiostoma floridae x Branchiostoma japonicum]